MFFFFFQAEDGIRDVAVTGVQTCALPISAVAATEPPRARGECVERGGVVGRNGRRHPGLQSLEGGPQRPHPYARGRAPRSEERRVGKEWRSRWSPYH